MITDNAPFMIPANVPIHAVVDMVITTLDVRDPYTYQHSFRVALFAERLGLSLELSDTSQQRLHVAAHLHDIGKIGVSDHILKKVGQLTPEEMREMQLHPCIGFRILTCLPTFRDIAHIVLHHHERIDGNGYPDGLMGDAIPLESRIIAVADTFDAMTSDRTYRAGLSVATAVAEINRCAGSQLDARIVAHFNRIYAELTPHVAFGHECSLTA